MRTSAADMAASATLKTASDRCFRQNLEKERNAFAGFAGIKPINKVDDVAKTNAIN